MADVIVLMRAGRIVQVADPATLYTRPADLEAARFLGIDNVVPRAEGDPLAAEPARMIGFRSTEARVETSRPDGAFVREGIVGDCAYVGGTYQTTVDCGGARLIAMAPSPLAEGSKAFVVVPPEALIGFEADRNVVLN